MFELEFQRDNGREPNNTDRLNFMQRIGSSVIEYYKSPAAQTETGGFNMPPQFSSIDEMNKELAANNMTVESLNEQLTSQNYDFDFANIMSTIQQQLAESDVAIMSPDEMSAATDKYLRENVMPQITDQIIQRLPAYMSDNLNQYFFQLTQNQFALDRLATAMGVPVETLDSAIKTFVANNQ